jgi:LysR family transcriptional regulator, hydrogen peroxide-inducible genes activator
MRADSQIGAWFTRAEQNESCLMIFREIRQRIGLIDISVPEGSGRLIIGAIPTIAPYFLPPTLSSFARKFPLVQISVVEEVTSELLNRVHTGAVDLALLALPVSASHCSCRELFRERLYVVVPSSHRLASLPCVHLAQIENDPFLLLKEGHCFRENTLAACGRARVRPNVVFESGQFTTILAMVAAGTGVSVVPEMAVEPRGGCRFLPLADEGASRRVGIVQMKRHFCSRVHREFLQHLRKQIPAGAAKAA